MSTTSTPPLPAARTRHDRVAMLPNPEYARDGHETVSLARLAERIAELLGCPFAGEYRKAWGGRTYLVPARTLRVDQARALGVRGPDDFYGGAVPHPFVATKVITHPAVSPGVRVPEGWSWSLGSELADVALPGFSVFDADSAWLAFERLRACGPLRLKPARGTGGNGQFVLHSAADLEDALAAVSADELAEHGATLEQHLTDSRTYSVGEVRLGGVTLAYSGTQRTIADRTGDDVYGGSQLRVVRGGFGALLEHIDDADECLAVKQAMRFDAAVSAAFPALFASRRNYDVIAGEDADGRAHCGVLEQSWRLGGATPAELAAFAAFFEDAELEVVVASCHEAHALLGPPRDAAVHYRDVDPAMGPITKYARIESHGHRA